ncbi:MAG: glutaredoxin [Chloroflexota bacterium]|nr:MAG: glutaredoxin [Chloroflexota bacterium]
MARTRKIEVFTAGCPLCDETVRLVHSLACPSCDVKVYDLRNEGLEKAREYGVSSVPTVAVDDKIASCCPQTRPNADALRAAGIGHPI